MVGAIGTVVIGSIAVYCIQMLLKCHYELCKRKKVVPNYDNVFISFAYHMCVLYFMQVSSMDYPTIAEMALLEGPTWIHKYSRLIVYVFHVWFSHLTFSK